MGTITQSRPQLCTDNERGSNAKFALGSVITLRVVAPNHEGGYFFNAETEAAATFVVLNSGLELYADLIARERGACLVINYNLQKMMNWAETLLYSCPTVARRSSAKLCG